MGKAASTAVALAVITRRGSVQRQAIKTGEICLIASLMSTVQANLPISGGLSSGTVNLAS